MFSHDASQGHINNRIRRVDIATGATTTLAGSGTRGYLDGAGGSARFNRPEDISIDPSGGFALVAVRASPAPPPASRHPAYRLPRTRCRLHPIPIATPHVAHRRGALRSDPSPPMHAITGHEQ